MCELRAERSGLPLPQVVPLLPSATNASGVPLAVSYLNSTTELVRTPASYCRLHDSCILHALIQVLPKVEQTGACGSVTLWSMMHDFAGGGTCQSRDHDRHFAVAFAFAAADAERDADRRHLRPASQRAQQAHNRVRSAPCSRSSGQNVRTLVSGCRTRLRDPAWHCVNGTAQQRCVFIACGPLLGDPAFSCSPVHVSNVSRPILVRQCGYADASGRD